MSQISPPIRILLIGAVVLAAAWVLVLKPKDDTSTPAATPAAPVTADSGTAQDDVQGNTSTKLGAAVEAAKGAATKSDQANNNVQSATGGTPDVSSSTSTAPATAPATTAPSTTAPAPSTEAPAAAADKAADPELEALPTWLQKSIDEKVVAILFYDKAASDDRRTRAALKDAYKVHGKVVTRSVPITKIAKYGSVARGVDVTQSPTLMVIDRDRAASSIVGYANVDAINQAIIDGVLATDNPAKKVPVVKVMQTACNSFATSNMVSAGDSTTVADYKAGLQDVSASLHTTLKQAPPLKSGPYSAQAKLLRKYVKSEQHVVSQIKGDLASKGTAYVDSKSIRKAEGSNDKLQSKATLELNAIGVTGCN